MSAQNRQSISRRGFLAGITTFSAAVGAFALSARAASAAPLSDPTAAKIISSGAAASSQRANQATPTAHTIGGNSTLDPMTSVRQDTTIRPFVVDVPQSDLDDLRFRLSLTRWPDQETVADRSQGVQLAKLQPLVQYWATDYDWRKIEAKLNALPNYKTQLDGLDIHFIHVPSRHPNALPLIMTHGWPGSIFEMLKIVAPLTDPTAYGGNAVDKETYVSHC